MICKEKKIENSKLKEFKTDRIITWNKNYNKLLHSTYISIMINETSHKKYDIITYRNYFQTLILLYFLNGCIFLNK